MNPNAREVESVVNLPADKRYEYFIKKVSDREAAWSLSKADGWALYGEDNGNAVLPIWPAKAFAELLARDEWQDYSPEEISLDALLEDLLPRMESSNVLVGVFPTPSGNAPTMAASQVMQDIQAELANY